MLEATSEGLTEDVDFPILALVVMTRQDGVMLALPELALLSEVMEAANITGAQGLVGPSVRVEVQACSIGRRCRVPEEDKRMHVVLVDFSVDVLQHMRAVVALEDI